MKLRTLLPMLALVFATAPGFAQEPAKQDVQKVIDEYTTAWAKGDAKAIAMMFTEDAIRVDAAGNVLVGRGEIQRSLETNFAGPWKGTSIRITAGRQQQVRPEVLVAEGTYEVSGLKDPAGKPMSLKGHYLNTMVREGGRLLLASNAGFLPQAAPGAQRKPAR